MSASALFEAGLHYEHVAGTDLTDAMEDAPHSGDALESFEVVGELIP